MADLIPVPGNTPVPQIETNTRVRGGPGGPANQQAQALLNRQALLEQRTDRSILSFPDLASAEAAAASLPDGQVVEVEVDAGLMGQTSVSKVVSGALAPTPWMFGLPSVWGMRQRGDTNDSAMFQRAADAGGRWQVPDGNYDISGVKVRTKLQLQCGEGVTFRRPLGSDIRQSYWNDGVACFEVDRCGASFHISGGFQYDGQESLQAQDEPTGFFVRAWAAVAGTEPLSVKLEYGIWRNGTTGYVLCRGDDYQRRWETYVDLVDPEFYDCRLGYGKGDPATTNALGWQPDFIQILDYVRFTARNFTGRFLGVIPENRYATVGIRGSFFGSDYAQSGGAHINLYGQTLISRLGRAARAYNNPNDFVTNNGIGAIDCYGNTDSMYVEHLIADGCENVPMRAKGSIKNFTLVHADLTNCWRGIQVSPSTTGPCEAVVNVGAVTSYGGTIPQIEFVGSSASDRLRSVAIGQFYQYGAPTNPELLSASTNGAITVRNTSRVSLRDSNIVGGSPTTAICLRGNASASIFSPVMNNVAGAGISWDGGGALHIVNPIGLSLGGPLVDGQNGGEASSLTVIGGESAAITNYCILNLGALSETTVTGHKTGNISGLSRGFYAAAGATLRLLGNTAAAGVTTPQASPAGAIVSEQINSWNPTIRYGGVFLTTVGTAKLGDIVYATAPTAGGNVGWVCVNAGSPGVWKTFAPIAA